MPPVGAVDVDQPADRAGSPESAVTGVDRPVRGGRARAAAGEPGTRSGPATRTASRCHPLPPAAAARPAPRPQPGSRCHGRAVGRAGRRVRRRRPASEAAIPLAACTMLSNPRRPDQGPSWPQASSWTHDQPGCRPARSVPHPGRSVEGTGPVAVDDDVGLVEQAVQGGRPAGRVQIEAGRCVCRGGCPRPPPRSYRAGGAGRSEAPRRPGRRGSGCTPDRRLPGSDRAPECLRPGDRLGPAAGPGLRPRHPVADQRSGGYRLTLRVDLPAARRANRGRHSTRRHHRLLIALLQPGGRRRPPPLAGNVASFARPERSAPRAASRAWRCHG